MVVVEDGAIDILHHIHPGTTNFLIKKTTNMKAIIGITDKGSPTKIKNLQIEELSKGKVPHLDRLTNTQENSDMKMVCTLQHHNESFQSCMFSPLEFIKVIEDID